MGLWNTVSKWPGFRYGIVFLLWKPLGTFRCNLSDHYFCFMHDLDLVVLFKRLPKNDPFPFRFPKTTIAYTSEQIVNCERSGIPDPSSIEPDQSHCKWIFSNVYSCARPLRGSCFPCPHPIVVSSGKVTCSPAITLYLSFNSPRPCLLSSFLSFLKCLQPKPLKPYILLWSSPFIFERWWSLFAVPAEQQAVP